jgi:predicted amidohydrolase YtcJ
VSRPGAGHVDRRRRGPDFEPRSPPDRILVGGVIWTGERSDLHAREGWAIAIGADRITALGPAQQILGLRDARTVVLDVKGGAILPGFVDAHVHLQAGGLDLVRVDLRGAPTPEALEHRVADRARLIPEGGWVLGSGWDHHAWGGTLPDRSWLDRAAPGHPVFLLRTDMHVGVASTEALRRAGIDRDTPDPDMGQIDRDPSTGEPTGILRERALELMATVIPSPSSADRAAAVRAAAQHALERGVTQVHDMGALQSSDESWASLETLRRLHAAGQLPIRVSAAVPLDDRQRLEALVAEEGGGDERLRWGSLKAFVDGSLGAGTAWFLEDYDHLPGHRGGPITELNALRRGIDEATALGLQPIVHAIGDAATSWLAEVFRATCARFPGRDLRLRMEHAQHVVPAIVPILAHPGIVCSMQPAHLLDDGPWAGARLGEGRERFAFAVRSLIEAGARPAFGSDWTVAPMDPLVALDAAVRREIRTPDGGLRVWNADERIGLAAALRAHTLDAARAAFFEVETGSLEPGKRADLVVLDASPFHLEEGEPLTALGVRATFVDGAPVWERDSPLGGE